MFHHTLHALDAKRDIAVHVQILHHMYYTLTLYDQMMLIDYVHLF